MAHRFLSLPVRPALVGVSWASLSVRMLPNDELRRARIEEAEQLSLFDLPERKQRPPLAPLGGRRFPVERFYFWSSRASKSGAHGVNFRAANTEVLKSKAAAAFAAVAST